MNRAILRAAMREHKANTPLANLPKCPVHPNQLVLPLSGCALCCIERAEAERRARLVAREQPTTEPSAA